MSDKLRMRFIKTGRSIYISHLDLMRTLQRAFKRAELPLSYSKGFNPHAQISVLLPLSVGMASRCELMDFRLDSECALSSLPERLNAVMPEGIEVLEVYPAERKVKELKWLRVEGLFEYDDRPAPMEELEAFFARERIVIERKTKRGTGQSDIRPAIRELRFSPAEEGCLLQAVVSAQEPTLNPSLLADALRQLAPELAPDFDSFERLEIYDSGMKAFR